MKMNVLLFLITLLINVNILTAQTALNFDGVNDLVVGVNNASLKLTQGTLEAWIKTSNAGDFYRGIIVKHGSYGFYLLDNVLVAYQWSGNTYFSSGTNLADGAWHHVAFAFNSGVTNGSKLYINGNPVFTFTYNLVTNESPINVGAGHFRESPPSQNFNGIIDQVRVWNTVRTDTEILANYTRCLSGTEPELVMLWHFEEGNSSSAVADLSGNSNTGTLLNMDAGSAWVAGYNCNNQPVGVRQPDYDRFFSINNKTLVFQNHQNLNEIKSVSIFCITGQKVYQTESITNTIELGDVKKGLYLVRIEKHDKTYSVAKIIVGDYW
jgi:hypothetical protein